MWDLKSILSTKIDNISFVNNHTRREMCNKGCDKRKKYLENMNEFVNIEQAEQKREEKIILNNKLWVH